ncbi:hypothetical protein BGW38_009983 [Lunasporangiospora selenospora]|uniref:Major Facilitator Superfamily protein n=1 Tax=Lunasporangiospora selenospora TaxID=979761 RepID=A0A9P6G212_9FUNG|nr:hypothetical protein BGW38_009983 [Lunasporangiospora selenospora]
MTTKVVEGQNVYPAPTYNEAPSGVISFEESYEGPNEPVAPNHRLLRIFVVNRGIGYVNLLSYFIACFATICIVAYLSIVQPFVLTTVLRITKDTGTITGSLALYDEILALPATLFWGVLSDRIGRRPVYSAAFICFGIALILYPYVKNVYPHMLLCRLLFSLGSAGATCMMTGTLSDVVGGQLERGRISAVVGMFAGIGGVVAGMVLINLPFDLGKAVGNDVQGLRLSMAIIGGCSLLLAVIFLFTIPDINPRTRGGALAWIKRCIRREKHPEVTRLPSDEPVNPLLMLKYGFLAGKDPRIALAYMSSFVVSFAGIVGAAGSIPFAFSKNDPAAKSNYAFLCLVGIGQIGMIVTGMTLVNGLYVDAKYRGSVAGVFSFCGAVSIMFMVRLGGHLFDVWMPGAPFVLMGAAHGIIALFSIYVRIVTPRLERQDRERMAAEQQREEAELHEAEKS